MRTPKPILFAHRGGRAHAPENSLEAFELAVQMGATGIETDVWCTSDGVPILQHDARLRSGFRRPLIQKTLAAKVPQNVPTLAALLALVGPEVALSIDLKDPKAGKATLDAVRRSGPTSRLWLCHPELSVLCTLRDLDEHVHLVHSTKLGALDRGVERHAAELSEAGVDAVNMPESDWSGGLVALYRRFGLCCLGWDAQHLRQIQRLVHLGLDGIYGDHVDRLVAGRGNNTQPESR